MAIAACNIEVRADGNDLNGGGFKIGGGDGGADYAYTNNPTAFTDLACASNTTLSTTAGTFAANHVHNLIQIASGTNALAGWYEITAVAGDGKSCTIDRTCATGGNMTSGVGRVGGALKTPGMAGKLMNDNALKGHVAHVKSGTTYTLTSADPNVAGGVVALNANMSTKGCAFVGYYLTRGDMGTAVEIDAGTYEPAAFFALDGADDNYQVICNINVTGKTGAATIGFYGDSAVWDYCIKCSATNCDGAYGFWHMGAIGCVATLCAGDGFEASSVIFCWAHNNGGMGFDQCSYTTMCLASLNKSDGFYTGSTRGIHVNCIAYKNGTSGTVSGFLAHGVYPATFINCISMANQSYGWEYSGGCTLINCAGDGNTSGDTHSGDDPAINYGFVNITTSPSRGIFENVDDSTNWDFRLKTTATEYASLYGQGLAMPGQTDWRDIGAVVRRMRASTFGLTVDILKDGETVDDVVGEYPTTEASQAAQKATDAAFLETNKDEIIQDDTDILAEFGVTGTAVVGGGGGGPLVGASALISG